MLDQLLTADCTAASMASNALMSAWSKSRPDTDAQSALIVAMSAAAPPMLMVAGLLAKDGKPTQESVLLAALLFARTADPVSVRDSDKPGYAEMQFRHCPETAIDALADFQRLSDRDPKDCFAAGFLDALTNAMKSADGAAETLGGIVAAHKRRNLN